MDLQAFAASRGDRLTRADEELAPLVRAALEAWVPDGDAWYQDLVEAASVLWLEIFEAEAPYADPDLFMPRYHEMLSESLSKTTEPANPVGDDQVHRLTYWLSTATVNNATYFGNRAHGGAGMRWITMRDESVRATHRAANGQIAGADGTFDIGGFDLRYPGEPVGPPEIWINCRCLLAPARVEGALTVSTPIIAAVEDEAEIEDIPSAVVRVETETGTYFYGPFDTAENAQRWIESDNAPWDGEFEVIPLTGVPTDVEVIDPSETEGVDDEPDDGEELITEIPVHGVSTIEGKPTGDGRLFEVGAVSWGQLPQPLGFEFESSHGGDNSRVAIIGRIDEFFKHDNGEYIEVRWRGVIHPDKDYASQAIEGILDGSYGGLSIIADSMTMDMEATELAFEEAPEGSVPVQHFSETRIRRHDMVPTPAFEEAWVGLGLEFADELSDGEREALAACGCDEYEVIDLSGDAMEMFRAAAEVEDGAYRDVSAEERKRLAEKGAAMPDGSYPIANCEDLRNAIQAIGRASDPDAVKRHIRKRKSALGCDDVELPEGWAIIEASAFAPGTKDGPGWITHPIPTARIRRYWVRGKGAAKIRWGIPGDFNRCRRQLAKYIANPDWLAGACANMHKEAIGVWPGQETGRGHHSTGAPMSITAAGLSTKPAEAFRDPQFTKPTPLTIDGDRIYGHVAQWGVCHIGIQDVCTIAPHSSVNYGYYRTGSVLTDEGRVAVGNITIGTGHAGLKASAKGAVAHYDNTGTVVADVVTGEDQHGIWFAGMVRPTATTEQLDALQASALSGDWRQTAHGLELVAALAVPVPGFPILSLHASAEEGQMSLVAAGAVMPEEAITAGLVPSADEIAGIVRTAIAEYRFQEKRETRLAALNPWIEETREAAVVQIADYFGKED